MGSTTTLAVLALLDVMGPGIAATLSGLLVLPAILFSLAVVFFGRWAWNRWLVPLTDPPPPSGSGWSIYRIVLIGGGVLWLTLTFIILSTHGRRASNDSGAVANLRTINTAQVTYMSRSRGDYASPDGSPIRESAGFRVRETNCGEF